jgi:hypothetical protein
MPEAPVAVFGARRYLYPPLAAFGVLIILTVIAVAENRPGWVMLGVGALAVTCVIFLPVGLVAHVRIAGDILTSSTGVSLRVADPGGPVRLDRLSSVVSVAHGRTIPLYRTAGLLPTALLELADADGGMAVIRTHGLSNAGELRSLLREAALRTQAQLDTNSRRYLGIDSPLRQAPHAGVERRYYVKAGRKSWRIR